MRKIKQSISEYFTVFYGYRLCEHKNHGGNHKGIGQYICYMILATLTS